MTIIEVASPSFPENGDAQLLAQHHNGTWKERERKKNRELLCLNLKKKKKNSQLQSIGNF